MKQLWNWVCRRKTQRFTNCPRPPRRSMLLHVEALETRELLASGVTATLAGSRLIVRGTAQADNIVVVQKGGRLIVHGPRTVTTVANPEQNLSGLIVGGEVKTSRPILIGAFAPSRVQRISVFGMGGADRIVIDSTVTVRDVRVDGGPGNDTIFGLAGRDQIVGGRGHDRIHVGIDLDRVLARRGSPLLPRRLQSNRSQDTDTYIVSLHLDALGRRLLRPIVGRVQQTVQTVFGPFVQRLREEVPLVSSLSRRFSGRAFTWVDLINRPQLNDFLAAYDRVVGFSVGTYRGSLKLGTFTVGPTGRVVDRSRLDPFKQLRARGPTQALRNLGFEIAILERPAEAVKMILGQPIELLAYTPPELSVSTSFRVPNSIPTPIPGLNINTAVGGQVAVRARGTIAFDSSGLSKGNVLSGFSVRNTELMLDPSVFLQGSLSAGVPGLFELAEFGVRGDLTGSLTAALPSEFRPRSVSAIAEALQLSGGIRAGANVFIRYRDVRTLFTSFTTDTLYSFGPFQLASF